MQLWNSTKSVDARPQLPNKACVHQEISEPLHRFTHMNYTGSLTNNQPGITEGHLLGISTDNPHICTRTHTHTHQKQYAWYNLLKSLSMRGKDYYRMGGYAKAIGFLSFIWIVTSKRGLNYAGRQLWLQDLFTSAMTIPWWRLLFRNIYNINCHTGKWQYAEVWK